MSLPSQLQFLCPLFVPCAAPTISLSMSEKGQLSRILSNRYGGFLTFAAMSPEKASAPGQPTVQQLSGLFNFKKQSKVGRQAGGRSGRIGEGGRGEGEGLASPPPSSAVACSTSKSRARWARSGRAQSRVGEGGWGGEGPAAQWAVQF